MNLTIKPCPDLTELSKITGLTENELSKKIIHILNKDLHCIEHWTDAGEMVSDVMLACGFRRFELLKRLPISTTTERYSHLVKNLQLWGTGDHECSECGCDILIDDDMQIEICENHNCGYKSSLDYTDYDEKRKLKHDNN